MRVLLQIAIKRKFRLQYRAAKEFGMDETYLSKIIHGRITPTAEQKARIASVLGADDIGALFHDAKEQD